MDVEKVYGIMQEVLHYETCRLDSQGVLIIVTLPFFGTDSRKRVLQCPPAPKMPEAATTRTRISARQMTAYTRSFCLRYPRNKTV